MVKGVGNRLWSCGLSFLIKDNLSYNIEKIKMARDYSHGTKLLMVVMVRIFNSKQQLLVFLLPKNLCNELASMMS